ADHRLHGRGAEESRLVRQPREESLGDDRAWRRDLGRAGRGAVGGGTRSPICGGGEGDADVRAVSRTHAAHDPRGRVIARELVNGLSDAERLPVALSLCLRLQRESRVRRWGWTAAGGHTRWGARVVDVAFAPWGRSSDRER